MRAQVRNKLRAKQFAFPRQRKEPIYDAKHVRNAISRFNQVTDVSDRQRDAAWRRIKRAAKKYGVDVSERSWRELGRPKDSSKGKKASGKGRGSKPKG
ncbi:MAG: hypothetical protein EPO13_08750 [Actinomycetota bacterium]|nr:MAG: hypothetical protein EPO13_08750 [Actinomycetota bacterium]